MKFDVIVGNPPYNPPSKDESGGSGSGNKIWQKFIEASFQNLKENGIVIMVTPTNWRHGNFNEKRHHKRAQQLMFDYGIQEWHSANHHFPKVGVEIDWWTCSQQNAKAIPEALKNSYFLPKNMDVISLSIYSDWLNFLKNECYVVDIKDNRSYDFSHTKGELPIDNVHVYKHVVTGSKTQNGFFHWYDKKTKGFDSKKVIVFGSSGPNPIYDKEGKIGCGHHATGYQVKNDFEAQEIIDFFNSKICNFLALEASSRKGFEFPKELFKRIPKNWRELEVKYFS